MFSFGKMYRFDLVLPMNFGFDSILSWLGVSFSELLSVGRAEVPIHEVGKND